MEDKKVDGFMTGLHENAQGAGVSPCVVDKVLDPQNIHEATAGGDSALARKYNNRWANKNEELVYEFTKDPALLFQYHKIYEEQFRIVHNAQRYHHLEDEHDRNGHILVVRMGNFCVGGARLNIKTPRNTAPLPIEMDGFKFENYFPELATKEMRYGQLGRICLLPEFRGGDATRKMLWHVYRKAAALGLDIVFATAPLVNARLYMRVARFDFVDKGYLKDTCLHSEIELPKYPMCEEIKFYLMSLVINKDAVIKEDAPLAKSFDFV